MKGKCSCGAVTFEARPATTTFGACHCETCRAWTGSAFLGITLAPDEITWTNGADQIRTWTSSSWAERGWCGTCGSNLFYRVTVDGPHQGQTHMAIGALENPDAFTFSHEIFIDRKPDCFAFSGERSSLTRAEVLERFAAAAEEMTE